MLRRALSRCGFTAMVLVALLFLYLLASLKERGLWPLSRKIAACLASSSATRRGVHRRQSAQSGDAGALSLLTCAPDAPPSCTGSCSDMRAFIRSEREASSWQAYYGDVARYLERHGVASGNESAVMVEVGTAYGGLSCHLLRHFPFLHIHAVDPFLGGYDDAADVLSSFYSSRAALRGISADAFSQLWADALAFDMRAEFGCRFHLHHGRSRNVSAAFPARSIDAIFIDGDHTLEGVVADIEAWTGVVKLGSNLLFNDYSDAFPGVMRAVDELAHATGQIVIDLGHSNMGLYNLCPLCGTCDM